MKNTIVYSVLMSLVCSGVIFLAGCETKSVSADKVASSGDTQKVRFVVAWSINSGPAAAAFFWL